MSNFARAFQSLKNAAAISLENAIRLQPDAEMSILEQVQMVRSNIFSTVPDLPDDIVHLITAATAVYRMRLSDMHIREQVLLLWFVEGEEHMRCHGRTCILPLRRLLPTSRNTSTGDPCQL